MSTSSLNVKNVMMNFQYILVLIFTLQIPAGWTNSTFRKHKVHNIVLYPDKHSWCTSTPIKQVISDVDCDPVEMDNRVCLGACFSYSIPRTLPANNVDEVNSYCDSCQPIKTSWVHVNLTCHDGSYRSKQVQLIKECRCSSCNRHWELENPPTIDVDDEEIPAQTSRYMELMKLKHDDENTAAEDEEGNNATDVPDIEMLDVINSTRLIHEENIWIRGPHHSKVLLKRKMTNVPDDGTQQYLGEDFTNKNKL